MNAMMHRSKPIATIQTKQAHDVAPPVVRKTDHEHRSMVRTGKASNCTDDVIVNSVHLLSANSYGLSVQQLQNGPEC